VEAVYSLPSHPEEYDMAPNVQRETTFPQGMSRRQAALPFAEGVENKLRRSPRRGLLCDRPLPGRCRSSPPSTSSAYERCLPESRPKAERFTPVGRRAGRRGGEIDKVDGEFGLQHLVAAIQLLQ
jgi:hypothetical protein